MCWRAGRNVRYALMGRVILFERRDYIVSLNPVYSSVLKALISWILEKGEEIYMSYGPHPNDFLFVECAYTTWSSFKCSHTIWQDIVKRWILPRNQWIRCSVPGRHYIQRPDRRRKGRTNRTTILRVRPPPYDHMKYHPLKFWVKELPYHTRLRALFPYGSCSEYEMYVAA